MHAEWNKDRDCKDLVVITTNSSPHVVGGKCSEARHNLEMVVFFINLDIEIRFKDPNLVY